LVSDTAELYELTGYTADEIQSLYHNNLLEMIDVQAQENLQKEIEEQLAAWGSVEVMMPVFHKNGSLLWIMNRGQLVVEEDGQEYLTGVLVDITRSKARYDEEKKATKVLQIQAERDSLTNIYNAQTARKKVEEYLANVSEKNDCALLIIDLDDFKSVNDQYGHMFGDEVLVKTAETIKNLFRSLDIVGRIGGEEFIVLMKDIPGREIVEVRCSQLNAAFHDIFKEELKGKELSCSIGVAISPENGTVYSDLFRHADSALYRAKDKGKDGYVFYGVE
jgi:putative two-component system response regulator